MPPKQSLIRENFGMFVLCVLFVVSAMMTVYLENAHKDDSVIVNWGMQITGGFAAAILALTVGKKGEANTHSGPTTNVIAGSPEPAPVPLVINNTTQAIEPQRPSKAP